LECGGHRAVTAAFVFSLCNPKEEKAKKAAATPITIDAPPWFPLLY
jgi:hypothetical protein